MVVSYVPPGAKKGFIMSVLDTNTEDDMVSKLRDLAKVGPSAFYLFASYKYLVSHLQKFLSGLSLPVHKFLRNNYSTLRFA